MKLSKEDRAEYEIYIEDRRVTESSVKTSWIEGKIEIAIEMIKEGEPNDNIIKYTGLADEEIEKLRKKV